MTQLFGLSQETPAPDRLLKEDDVIDIGELHFRVLHTPGHSPGGICLLEKDEGIVFTFFYFKYLQHAHDGLDYGLSRVRILLTTLPSHSFAQLLMNASRLIVGLSPIPKFLRTVSATSKRSSPYFSRS